MDGFPYNKYKDFSLDAYHLGYIANNPKYTVLYQAAVCVKNKVEKQQRQLVLIKTGYELPDRILKTKLFKFLFSNNREKLVSEYSWVNSFVIQLVVDYLFTMLYFKLYFKTIEALDSAWLKQNVMKISIFPQFTIKAYALYITMYEVIPIIYEIIFYAYDMLTFVSAFSFIERFDIDPNNEWLYYHDSCFKQAQIQYSDDRVSINTLLMGTLVIYMKYKRLIAFYAFAIGVIVVKDSDLNEVLKFQFFISSIEIMYKNIIGLIVHPNSEKGLRTIYLKYQYNNQLNAITVNGFVVNFAIILCMGAWTLCYPLGTNLKTDKPSNILDESKLMVYQQCAYNTYIDYNGIVLANYEIRNMSKLIINFNKYFSENNILTLINISSGHGDEVEQGDAKDATATGDENKLTKSDKQADSLRFKIKSVGSREDTLIKEMADIISEYNEYTTQDKKQDNQDKKNDNSNDQEGGANGMDKTTREAENSDAATTVVDIEHNQGNLQNQSQTRSTTKESVDSVATTSKVENNESSEYDADPVLNSRVGSTVQIF